MVARREGTNSSMVVIRGIFSPGLQLILTSKALNTRAQRTTGLVRKNLSSEAPNEWHFLLVSVDFAGAAAATTSVSHQRSGPLDHIIQIELGNLAPIGQHRRSR
jgi:hypothetical protein